MSTFKMSNKFFCVRAVCFFLCASSYASDEVAVLLDEYLLNSGKPTERNAEIWTTLARSDDEALLNELDRLVSESNGFLPRLHIAQIASSLLPREQARSVVLEALAASENEQEASDLRHLFAESVAKVALPEDASLLESFRDPNRRAVNSAVESALERIALVNPKSSLPSENERIEDGQQVAEENVPVLGVSSSPEDESPSQSPVWSYVLVALALVGIVVVLIRSRKGDPGR